jgi:hypothetical protein
MKYLCAVSAVTAAVAAFILVGGASCGTGSAGVEPAGRDAGEGGFDAGSLPTPHPLSVSPVLDTANASSEEVPVAGGMVKAVGADGTEFELVVPANALLAPTTITLMPVKSIGGLPLSGGLQAAVQISPDGLEIYEVASLTVTPKTTVPVTEQIGFGYLGSGSDFHLEPLQTGTGPAFGLVHFSGYGVGRGAAADVTAQMSHFPKDLDDELEQELAHLQLGSGVPLPYKARSVPRHDYLKTPEEIYAELQWWYDNVVGPDISNAMTPPKSCSSGTAADILAVEDAITVAAEFEQRCSLYNDTALADTVQARLGSLINDFLNLAYNNVKAHCHEPHTNFSSYAALGGKLERLSASAGPGVAKLINEVNMCQTSADAGKPKDGGPDGSGTYYCSCNTTCYTDETTCLADCNVTLGCFTGICGPGCE